MARSLKKGPFADESLLKKVDAMNAAGDKQVIKTWSRFPRFSRPLLDIPLRFMTAESMFRYTLRKTWSDTSSVSSYRPEHSAVITEITKNPARVGNYSVPVTSKGVQIYG